MKLESNPNMLAMTTVLSIMKAKGISKAELARRMDVTGSYVSNWIRRGLPPDRLCKAAEALSVSIDQIVGRTTIPEGAVPVVLNGNIPVIGYARLGNDGFYAISMESDAGFLEIPSKDPRAYALRCEGTSMMPRIQHGEFVIAEPSFEASAGDEVVVQANDDRVMVKRFLYQRDGIYHFGSVNSEHETILIDSKDIRAIHPVLAIIPKRFLRIK